MNLRQLRISRRTIAVATALAGTVSLASAPMRAQQAFVRCRQGRRHRADRDPGGARARADHRQWPLPGRLGPLAQPSTTRNLSATLRRNGFTSTSSRMRPGRHDPRGGADEAKIKPDTVVMLFFGGYGVQVGREAT